MEQKNNKDNSVIFEIESLLNKMSNQVNFLIRKEMTMNQLDIDLLMENTRKLYDTICSVELGVRSVELGVRSVELGVSYGEICNTGFSPYSIIINTTPVGMFPNVNDCLELPYSTIEPDNIFIDLIYNPEETLFLKKARMKGASTFNGMTMLYEQAEAAWEIWNNS